MTHRTTLPLLAALALDACSSAPAGGPDRQDAAVAAEGASPEAAVADARTDVASEQDTSAPAPEASTPVDAGAEASDAGSEASVCSGLGGPCTDGTTCLCGSASGCLWDNVTCSDAGICVVAYTVPVDAGQPCCSSCQADYDSCTASASTCLAQWLACNAACPGGGGPCPVVCAAGL